MGGRKPELVPAMTAHPGNRLEESLDRLCDFLRESQGNKKEEEECAMASGGQR